MDFVVEKETRKKRIQRQNKDEKGQQTHRAQHKLRHSSETN
jgi:hypothetical protein